MSLFGHTFFWGHICQRDLLHYNITENWKLSSCLVVVPMEPYGSAAILSQYSKTLFCLFGYVYLKDNLIWVLVVGFQHVLSRTIIFVKWQISGVCSCPKTVNTRLPVSNPIMHMWQFEKENVPPKLFFLTLFWQFVMFFQLDHIIPLLYSQTISLWTET
jgi:hypothetical protein